ncbi:unnamed protein product [Lactuca virosa]|uniref:Uncharacterized protein n=1 Tax=Lactuca virosa TaxID=75947 RepID=A0AAU9LVY8_9ASTR|nr:unnamed protein product [Lactuca virosa]
MDVSFPAGLIFPSDSIKYYRFTFRLLFPISDVAPRSLLSPSSNHLPTSLHIAITATPNSSSLETLLFSTTSDDRPQPVAALSPSSAKLSSRRRPTEPFRSLTTNRTNTAAISGGNSFCRLIYLPGVRVLVTIVVLELTTNLMRQA